MKVLERPVEGIAVDAAHSLKHGRTEYRGVDVATGEEIFRSHIGNQTVNIGEFLAVVDAARVLLVERGGKGEIWTDSLTAIAWYNACTTGSAKKYGGIEKAEMFLQFTKNLRGSIKIRKWNTRLWGDVPADFGRK